jgi:uncharacterized protein with NRDE domain
MCILSIVRSAETIIITSNRDEQRSRKNSQAPEIIDLGKRQTILARDAQAHGTWLLTDNSGRTAILLNGAFESHIPSPPYRESRGIILMNLFQEDNFRSAFLFYNFENIEPFQIIYVEKNKALQCLWDGSEKHLFEIDLSTPQVFFSPTLYSKELQSEKKKHFFETFADYNLFSAPRLFKFHSEQNENSNLNFFMNREQQTTKSISQIELNSTFSKYVHWQAWDNQKHELTLEHVANA